MFEPRIVKLLRLGPDQVIEIPADWELPEGRVVVDRNRDMLVISPKDETTGEDGSIDAPAPPA
jgi:virulence-associated protein VagC